MLRFLTPLFLLLAFSATAQDSLKVRNPSEGYAIKKGSVYENVVMSLLLEDSLFQSDSIVLSYHHPKGGPAGVLASESEFTYSKYKKRGFWKYELSMKTADESGTHDVVFVAEAYEAGKVIKTVNETVTYMAQEGWSRDIEVTLDKSGSDEFIYDQLNILLSIKNTGDVPFPNNTTLTLDYYDGDNPEDTFFMSTNYNLGDIAPGETVPVRVKFDSWHVSGVIGGSTYTCYRITPRISGGERFDDNMANNTDCMQMYNTDVQERQTIAPVLLVNYTNGSLLWNEPLELNSEASIFNINGACVWKGRLQEGIQQISINDALINGMYVLRFNDGKGSYATRFMVSE